MFLILFVLISYFAHIDLYKPTCDQYQDELNSSLNASFLFWYFRYYGQLSVPADRKWDDIFHHCCSSLGHDDPGHMINTNKAWEMVAVAVSSGKKQIKEMQKMFVNSPWSLRNK